MSRELDMDLITRLVREQGHPAYVEQTGGGCATIYAGKPDPLSDTYPVLAGPGWFERSDWTMARADSSDFYIGPPESEETLVFPAEEDEQYAAKVIVDLLGGPNLPYMTDGGHVTVRLPKEDEA